MPETTRLTIQEEYALFENYESLEALLKHYPAIKKAVIKTMNGDVSIDVEEDGLVSIHGIRTAIQMNNFKEELLSDTRLFDEFLINITLYDFFGVAVGVEQSHIKTADIETASENAIQLAKFSDSSIPLHGVTLSTKKNSLFIENWRGKAQIDGVSTLIPIGEIRTALREGNILSELAVAVSGSEADIETYRNTVEAIPDIYKLIDFFKNDGKVDEYIAREEVTIEVGQKLDELREKFDSVQLTTEDLGRLQESIKNGGR